MTNFKTTAALIALMAAAPMASFAAESGSPAQSVENDSDEYAVDEATGESMEDTAKAGQGAAYKETDVVEDADGSLIEDDAKSDG